MHSRPEIFSSIRTCESWRIDSASALLQSDTRFTLQLGMMHAAATDAGRETSVAWDIVMTSTTDRYLTVPQARALYP